MPEYSREIIKASLASGSDVLPWADLTAFTEKVIAGRMARARDEISHWDTYDYVLINDDLDRCEQEIRGILAAERLRRERRPGLVGVVQALNAEFQETVR